MATSLRPAMERVIQVVHGVGELCRRLSKGFNLVGTSENCFPELD